MAPEVSPSYCNNNLETNPLDCSNVGYDGMKADMFSIGVILYSLLVGVLPFSSDFNTCPRYKLFTTLIRNRGGEDEEMKNHDTLLLLEDLDWFFSPRVEIEARALLTSLLHYNPNSRPSAAEALQYPWVKQDQHSGSSE